MSAPDKEQSGSPPDKASRFVTTILKRCDQDKGYAARLRRADNPDTEYQSWEVLAAFGIDLEKEYQRIPYVAVAAAMAKMKTEKNGNLSLGKAIAACYENGNKSDQARAKMRRLLACEDTAEACRILRPLFALINSKVNRPLDFVRILRQLLKFHWYKKSIRAQWAQEFYARNLPVKEEAA